jgi:hypothetical protein
MAKLLAFYQAHSPVFKDLLGQCDARCYRQGAEGRPKDCDCICHGLNHGVGFDKALANTRSFAVDWLTLAIQAGWQVDSVFTHAQVDQFNLFINS